ncbi:MULTISPECIES: helix-turn-helix domain-containing protein [unclassified Nocardioides]|uniref:helix-turn-helix domain-containing protein n=1 Tax=unclassified Nocardioides TaxID=2615069 RepID=UPI003616EC55
MLDVLGLDRWEEGAYRRLVAHPSQSAEALADAMEAEVAQVATALSALEERGLVARSSAAPDHFVASPPTLALGSLIVQREEEIRRAQLELGRLAEQYRHATADRSLADVIDVVRGSQAVAQRFSQMQRGASTEVLALVKASVAVVTAEENTAEDAALERGVTYRVVVERAAFERAGFLDEVAEAVDAGEVIRVADEIPLRLVVADRSLALLPLAPTSAQDDDFGALLVHPSGLLDALLHLFDLVWASANAVVPSEHGVAELAAEQIDDVDARILTLLLAGLTDQAIGGQLALSLRTVQRRVAGLMERARVTTRFQLGHEAARRGWVGA